MYVVVLDYAAPLEEIDYLLPDHVAWLERQYQAGYFLASGRRRPMIGSVIIVRAMPRAKLTALLATDPFALRRLVRYEVLDFQATRTIRALWEFNEAA